MDEFIIQHRFVYMAYEAERTIKLVKDAIAALSHAGNKVWIDFFPSIIDTLNKRVHRELKMIPKDAVEKVDEARRNLGNYWKCIKQDDPETFAVVDHVRLQEDRGTFAKGHVETFSHDVYKISHVFPPRDKFRSHRYGVEGNNNKVFTYNDLMTTTAKVNVQEKPKPKDRLQKQAEKELRELDGKVIRKRLRPEKEEFARRPKETFLHVEIPERKRTKK